LSPGPPAVRAPAAILIDLRTGGVLFAKHPDQHRPIASISKIMTAILVLERARLSDVVAVSRTAAKAPPIDLGLKTRQRITVGDLLWGLLLWSGNDASVALAEHVSGSLPAFKRLMNARGQALGLRDTYFASPSGLDDHGYSTVRDVAVLARAALRSPMFAQIVATRRHWIPGPKGQIHRLQNLNELLRAYPGAIGVKTGYTEAAGNCVVGAATRGNSWLLAVVLGDPAHTRWRAAYADIKKLLDYGFFLELPARLES
jgi:D-alanyl-D-alanine carboxypeptidase (penicillin-binding protein 5/6)